MTAPAQIDLIELAALRHAGWEQKELAEYYGVARSTVARYLDDIGLTEHTGGGPSRQETCARGHSMEDAYEKPGGGRECKKCHQERGRRNHQAKKERQRQAQVQPAQ